MTEDKEGMFTWKSVLIDEEQLKDLFKAAGLEFIQTSTDFEICIDDGNDSVFYLDYQGIY